MLWDLWTKSKEWGKRPSEMLTITDPYHAWCFDEACAVFGRACEAAMADARKDRSKGKKGSKQSAEQREAKAENALRRMLGIPQKFRNIGDLAGR